MTSTTTIGTIATFSKGSGLAKSDLASDGARPCIHYGELFTQYGAVVDSVRSRTHRNLPVKSATGDVLMPTSDVTPRGLAKASALVHSGVGLGSDILIIRPDSTKADSRFLAYTIRHDANQVLGLVRGSTVYHLYAADMRHFEVPLIPLAEQARVADALRDADHLIIALERLIAKKQAIKQGMMQQLLTGKTRLPGFADEWQPARLGDVLTVRHGKSQRGVEVPSGPYPILATGGQIGWAHTPLYSKPSVLIGRKGTIDRPQYQDRPFWTVDTLFYTEVSPSVDPRFLYYVFLMVDWGTMNEASGVPSLSSARVEGVDVRLPRFAEQVAIRRALDDADHEISALQSRLAKARAVKTGMMQELLTGRTRLPIKEDAR